MRAAFVALVNAVAFLLTALGLWRGGKWVDRWLAKKQRELRATPSIQYLGEGLVEEAMADRVFIRDTVLDNDGTPGGVFFSAPNSEDMLISEQTANEFLRQLLLRKCEREGRDTAAAWCQQIIASWSKKEPLS